MPDITYRDALRNAHNGDVPPEGLTYLRMPSGAYEIKGAGWSTFVPSDDPGTDPARGIVNGLIISIVLWTLVIIGVSFAAGWRPWRF